MRVRFLSPPPSIVNSKGYDMNAATEKLISLQEASISSKEISKSLSKPHKYTLDRIGDYLKGQNISTQNNPEIWISSQVTVKGIRILEYVLSGNTLKQYLKRYTTPDYNKILKDAGIRHLEVPTLFGPKKNVTEIDETLESTNNAQNSPKLDSDMDVQIEKSLQKGIDRNKLQDYLYIVGLFSGLGKDEALKLNALILADTGIDYLSKMSQSNTNGIVKPKSKSKGAPNPVTTSTKPLEPRVQITKSMPEQTRIPLIEDYIPMPKNPGKKKTTGLSYLPSEIGSMFENPVSGKKINARLEELGLQVKVGKDWYPTPKSQIGNKQREWLFNWYWQSTTARNATLKWNICLLHHLSDLGTVSKKWAKKLKPAKIELDISL